MAAARRWTFPMAVALLATGVHTSGCDDGETTGTTTPGHDAGTGGQGGSTVDAGPTPGACEPGQLEQSDGSCLAAGIPPDGCASGFEIGSDGGCEAILPATPCGPGQLALPGETTCRQVAPCGAGPYGDIPTDPTTQHVDRSYGGPTSDGSAAQPWTTIQQGVDAATPGAIVAIAAGTYAETVQVHDQAVKLWGKCPAEVELAPPTSALPVVHIWHADGTEVRSLSMVGPNRGIAVNESADVVLDRLWIHGDCDVGVDVRRGGMVTSARLTRSLLESVKTTGAAVWAGGALTIEDTVVRDSLPMDQGILGWGASAMSSPGHDPRSSLVVRRSLFERNYEQGIRALGADVAVESTLVRDTLPSIDEPTDGDGIMVGREDGDDYLSTFSVVESVVEANHSCGICALNAHTTIEATTVRGTLPTAATGATGYGIAIASDRPPTAPRPAGSVRSCLITANHGLGLGVVGADAVFEAVAVQDTACEELTGMFGRGVVAELSPETGTIATMELTGSIVEGSHEVGVIVMGSEAAIASTVIRDTRPRTIDDLFGRGMIVQLDADVLTRSEATLTHVRIEDSYEVGLYVAGADATVTDTVVTATMPRAGTDLFGDGLIAAALAIPDGIAPASVTLERCLVADSERAGLASFGATMALSGTALECNAISMAGELFHEQPFELSDGGGNLCGCAGEAVDCQVLSTGLTPPDPL